MTTHVLRTLPHYFDAVARGHKTFEIRRNDRMFQVGDVLKLVRMKADDRCTPECTSCNHPSIRRGVTYVFSCDPALKDMGGVAPGYVVLGLCYAAKDGDACGY